ASNYHFGNPSISGLLAGSNAEPDNGENENRREVAPESCELVGAMSYSQVGCCQHSSSVVISVMFSNFAKLARRVFWLQVLLLPVAVRSVIFEPISIEALSRRAEVIAQGTVLSKTCQADPA